MKTKSPAYSSSVDHGYMLYRLFDVVSDFGEVADSLKSSIFQGRPYTLPKGEPPDGSGFQQGWHGDVLPRDVFHAVLGVLSESGEIAKIAKAAIARRVQPQDKLDKEFGDILWYVACYCEGRGIDMGYLMRQNIAKLRARHGESFDPTKANRENRDTAAEENAMRIGDDGRYHSPSGTEFVFYSHDLSKLKGPSLGDVTIQTPYEVFSAANPGETLKVGSKVVGSKGTEGTIVGVSELVGDCRVEAQVPSTGYVVVPGRPADPKVFPISLKELFGHPVKKLPEPSTCDCGCGTPGRCKAFAQFSEDHLGEVPDLSGESPTGGMVEQADEVFKNKPGKCYLELTYFKDSGKYYASGIWEADMNEPLFEIWGKIEKANTVGGLPGLVESSRGWTIYVDGAEGRPQHPHQHPHLIHRPDLPEDRELEGRDD